MRYVLTLCNKCHKMTCRVHVVWERDNDFVATIKVDNDGFRANLVVLQASWTTSRRTHNIHNAWVRHQHLGVNEKLLLTPSVFNLQVKVKEWNVSPNIKQQPLFDCLYLFSETKESEKKNSLVTLRCFGPTPEHGTEQNSNCQSVYSLQAFRTLESPFFGFRWFKCCDEKRKWCMFLWDGNRIFPGINFCKSEITERY